MTPLVHIAAHLHNPTHLHIGFGMCEVVYVHRDCFLIRSQGRRRGSEDQEDQDEFRNKGEMTYQCVLLGGQILISGDCNWREVSRLLWRQSEARVYISMVFALPRHRHRQTAL